MTRHLWLVLHFNWDAHDVLQYSYKYIWDVASCETTAQWLLTKLKVKYRSKSSADGVRWEIFEFFARLYTHSLYEDIRGQPAGVMWRTRASWLSRTIYLWFARIKQSNRVSHSTTNKKEEISSAHPVPITELAIATLSAQLSNIVFALGRLYATKEWFLKGGADVGTLDVKGDCIAWPWITFFAGWSHHVSHV